ncbi:MAG: hypothetical protein C4523_01535 [Myxococcales bacterium]|nr:MAG: hypothetical protein C4523_01535 [Myxococcales bacterium]
MDGENTAFAKIEPLILRRTPGDRSGPFVLGFFAGKGGVGQSVLAANIAVHLAQTGKRVLLVDAVRWGQNLHTFLDVPAPEQTLDLLKSGDLTGVESLIIDTPYDKLKLLCGMREGMSSTSSTECPFLIRAARMLPFDFVILDLGCHPSFNLFDHAIWSDFAVLTTVPEPTAMEGAYEVLRGLYFRLFKTIEAKLGIEDIVNKAMMTSHELGIRTPGDLVSAIHFFRPESGDRMGKEIERLRLLLILNAVRTTGESDVGDGVVSVCKRYFGFNIELLGFVDHDNTVPAAVRQRKPLHAVQKDSKCTRQIEKISYKLMSLGILDKQDEG